MRTVSVVAAAVLVLSASGETVPLAAQAKLLVFDVASVKPNRTSTNLITQTMSPSGVIFENLSLEQIISQAYQLRTYLIAGLPGWARQENFDIQAKTSEPHTIPEQLQMLRNLLADRFGLLTHREPREIRLYELSIASSDGTLGSQLRRSTLDCSTKPSPCRLRMQNAPGGASTDVIATGAEWARLRAGIETELDGPLRDRTSLQGLFDMELRFGRNQLQRDIAPDSSSALFTAVREQLGLKIERTVGQWDVLVIDAVMRPTAN
jgi:uncharacterized protein (TIGR03435 family)